MLDRFDNIYTLDPAKDTDERVSETVTVTDRLKRFSEVVMY